MSRNSRKSPKILAAALAASLAFGTIGYAAPLSNENGNSSHSQDQKIIARVNAERAIEHVRYLSEEIGTRPGGLENEKKSAEYIANTLKSYGYDVEFQYFPVADQFIGSAAFEDGTVWEMGAAPNGAISDTPVHAEVIFVENENFQGAEGKIVHLARADTTAGYREQVAKAVEAGAAGVILQSLVGSRGNYGQTFNPNLTSEYDIPVFGASYIHGEWLKEQMEQGAVELSLSAKHYKDLKSVNVIATKEAKSKDEDTKRLY